MIDLWALSQPPLHSLASVGDLCEWRGRILNFFLSLQSERCFLRAWWGLLGFNWAVSNHVWDTLTEVAFFWLRRQLALFCMVVYTSTVVAPEKWRLNNAEKTWHWNTETLSSYISIQIKQKYCTSSQKENMEPGASSWEA